jgi:hypothetical protein
MTCRALSADSGTPMVERMNTRPPKLSEHVACVLVEGPADGTILPIAPTMKNITHSGERYFRMSSWREFDDGTTGALYLWDGWAAQKWPHIYGKEKDDA